jgi:hypothetical protein
VFFKRKKENVPSLFSSPLEKKVGKKRMCVHLEKEEKTFAIARRGHLLWRCLAVSSAEMRVQVIIDRLVAPLKNEKGRKKGTVFLFFSFSF